MTALDDICVCVFTGGWTPEYEISIQSAKNVINELKKAGFSTRLITIKKNGMFLDDNGLELKHHIYDAICDIAFVVIHGSPGENGLLHSFFELIGKPYIGSPPDVLALTMNKFATLTYVKMLLPSLKIPETLIFNKKNNIHEVVKAVRNKFSYPVFVKPNRMGSSVLASIVHNDDELLKSVGEILQHDREALIQEYIKGVDLTCGVIEWKGRAFPLAVTLIKPPQGRFFDYHAKYSDKETQEIVPAPIDKHIYETIMNTSKTIFEMMGLRLFSRFDFLFDEHNGNIYFLEVNTIPGLTTRSLLPAQMQYVGISLADLLKEHILAKLSEFSL